MQVRAVTLTQAFRDFLPRAIWARALFIQLFSLCAWTVLMRVSEYSPFWFELQRLIGAPYFSWLCLGAYLLTITLLTICWRLPVWWCWIQPLFVLAVIGLQRLHIDSQIYLAGFLLSSLVYWTVYQTRVPFYPSFPSTWQALIRLLNQRAGQGSLQVLEIGSGLGDVAMSLSCSRPQDHVAGIEIAPLPWLVSWFRAMLRRSRVHFQLGDYRKHDFRQQDVVFAYLSPAVMSAVWQKASQEMRPGSLLVSSEFPIDGVPFTECIQPAKGAPALYLYQLA